MMYDALYGRQSIEKKDSISVESQLEYCRYETHGDPYIEYADSILHLQTAESNYLPTEVLVGRIPTDRTLKG